MASWESLTGTKPTIESDRTIATVSFPLKSALQHNDAKNDAKNDAENLTERQSKILTLIKDNPKVSLDSIAISLGISAPTIDREMKKMSYLIQHVCPKKGGHWKIIGNNDS